MSKFEIFKEDFNPKILVFILVGVVLNLIVNVLSISRNTYWILSDGSTSALAPKIEFCNIVGEQLIRKELSEKIVNKDIYPVITKNKYSAFEFDGSERIFGVSEQKSNCEISIKDSIGVRVFKMGLSENRDWPSLGYVITSVYESEKGE